MYVGNYVHIDRDGLGTSAGYARPVPQMFRPVTLPTIARQGVFLI